MARLQLVLSFSHGRAIDLGAIGSADSGVADRDGRPAAVAKLRAFPPRPDRT